VSDEEFISRQLADFFKEEPYKAVLWIMVKNPHFGNISPLQLIAMGRIHRVKQFIENAKEGNMP